MPREIAVSLPFGIPADIDMSSEQENAVRVGDYYHISPTTIDMLRQADLQSSPAEIWQLTYQRLLKKDYFPVICNEAGRYIEWRKRRHNPFSLQEIANSHSLKEPDTQFIEYILKDRESLRNPACMEERVVLYLLEHLPYYGWNFPNYGFKLGSIAIPEEETGLTGVLIDSVNAAGVKLDSHADIINLFKSAGYHSSGSAPGVITLTTKPPAARRSNFR